MLKPSKINPSVVIVLLLTSIFFSSCGGSGFSSNSSGGNRRPAARPLDPEELGYYKEFGELWQPAAKSTYSILEIDSVVKLNSEINKTDLSYDQEAKLKNAFNNLKDMADRKLSTLEQTLPPSSIGNFHSQWINLLKAVRISNAQDKAVIIQSKNFYAAYSKLDKDLKDRPKEIQLDDGPMSVEFKPMFLPVAGNVNIQSGAFSLVLSREIVTPLGSASVDVTSQQSASPKFLVIQHSSKRRYVYLSPGSKFFVPAKCGVDLLNEREDSKIIVNVVKCPQDKAQPEPVETSSPRNFQASPDSSQKDFDFDIDRLQKVVNSSVVGSATQVMMHCSDE